MVREACARHGCSPATSVALGRALMGTVLLASGRDAGESMQLRITGGGPCGAIIAEATSTLQCRGFVAEPTADAPTIPELVGLAADATLRITRTHPFWRSPYTGTTQLKSGEIAEDIVQYLALSEQTPASMGLSVEWDSDAGCVKNAEGWLVTLLPGWDEVSVSLLEANIVSFSSMDRPEGMPAEDAICRHLMRELAGEFCLEEKVNWRCTCSEDRLLRSVMMLGKDEVFKIVEEGKTVDARCDWCGSSLSVTVDKVKAYMETDDGVIEALKGRSSPRGLKLDEAKELEMPSPGKADWT